MKKTPLFRKLLTAAAAVLIYLGLLLLLVLAESRSPDANIRSLLTAFWYSVTTLTTVGYGDTYPVTTAGRLIGLIFQLMSLGVLVAVLSLILQLVQGRLLPRIRLRLARKKNWYLFADGGKEALTLAENIKKEEKDALILLPASAKRQADPSLQAVFTELEPEQICRARPDPDRIHVFFLDQNPFENEKKAEELVPAGCRISCLSEGEPRHLSDQLNYFRPDEACARLYWHRYPLKDSREKIVLTGGGRFGRALLDQALLLNVLAPDQAVRYVLAGDWDEYFREHPFLDQIAGVNREEGRDVIQYQPGPWNADWQVFQEADRIIFCADEEAENAQRAETLLRCCPLKGTVHARISRNMDRVVSFGSCRELCLPELVTGRRLNRLASQLHEKYRSASSGNVPAWNELSPFLRRSNAASADHLPVKAQILLGEEDRDGADSWEKAAAKYRTLSEEEKDRCRRIEHERWMRFHLLNNWQYGPVRDNERRIHPLILPFDELSQADQAKDDYAWELLGEAARIRRAETAGKKEAQSP